jgi:hypothetical protein
MRKVMLLALPFTLILFQFAPRWSMAEQGQGGGRKPIKDRVVHVDTSRPPSTGAALARESAAVVVARYAGQSRLVDESANGPMRTFYTFEIEEIVKHSAYLLSDRLEIALHGGEKEFPTHIERTLIDGAEPIKKNHSYIIFLALNLTTNRLYVAYETAGLYDITGGRISAVQHSRARDNGKAVSRFIDELRATGTGN